MKKLAIYILFVSFSINVAVAQKEIKQDPAAKAILAKVSAKYRSYTSIKTDFNFVLDVPQSPKQTQSGTLITATKTGKYKVIMTDQDIITDGKTQWTYLKKDKEVQVANAAKTDDEMNPAKLFTVYEKGYKYVYTGDQKVNGKLCQVIDLAPEDEKKTFFKIRLMIDKAKAQIYSAILFDKNGSHYSYTLSNFTPNVKVTDADFTYNKSAHSGVEVVDLR